MALGLRSQGRPTRPGVPITCGFMAVAHGIAQPDLSVVGSPSSLWLSPASSHHHDNGIPHWASCGKKEGGQTCVFGSQGELQAIKTPWPSADEGPSLTSHGSSQETTPTIQENRKPTQIPRG